MSVDRRRARSRRGGPTEPTAAPPAGSPRPFAKEVGQESSFLRPFLPHRGAESPGKFVHGLTTPRKVPLEPFHHRVLHRRRKPEAALGLVEGNGLLRQ